MKPKKRNILDGVDHMGSIYKAMPTIALFIEAEYVEEDLDKAYCDFQNIEQPEEPLPDDHNGYGVWWTNWTLKGKEMSFTICFEKHEGYYGWAINCKDELTYNMGKEVLKDLLRF